MTIEDDYPSITLPWTILDFECITFPVKDGIIDAQALIKAIELNKNEINDLSVEVIHERSMINAEQLVQLLEKHPVKLH